MVRVSIPKKITEPSIVSLLHSKTTLLCFDDIKKYDMKGKRSFKTERYGRALYEKLIAAISYQRRSDNFKDPFFAALCYDKASTSAYLSGFETVDLICAIRSTRLHSKNLEFLKDLKNLERFLDPEDTLRRTREGLDFAKGIIWKHQYKPLIPIVHTDNHVWFPKSHQVAAAQ